MNRGYVHLWRKVKDSAVFQNEGLFKVFIWCLLRANYKENFVPVKTGRGFSEVRLLPGTFLFGRDSAARELNMKPSTVWNRIMKLKKLEFLNIESNSHYSIIYIINWNIYQAPPEKKNSKSDRQVTGNEHREELKNNKNKKMSESDLAGFESFYSHYPKHEAKKKALDAWIKLNPDNNLKEQILNAIENQKRHKARLKDRNEFCPAWPLPATWLKGHRWEDEIPNVKEDW
mgnify:CR=1 FL=1